jgi:hypothetical protein
MVCGESHDCGEIKMKNNLIHGQSRGKDGKATAEYTAYRSAKNRCANKNHKHYSRYGGRGIKFCFDSFQDFFAYVGRRPSGKHSLDRINNSGNYEKGNLRWATRSMQSRNTSNNKYLTINGTTLLMCEWAERSGLTSNIICGRLKSGWCVECAVTRKRAKGYCGCPHRKGVKVKKMITFNGETLPLRGWERKFGLGAGTLLSRLKMGWSIQAALTTKARNHTQVKEQSK